jgi:hypothetical protein
MAQTTPPSITPAPTAPQRSNRATFSGLVDAFVTWLISAVTQFSSVATNVYNNAVDCYNNAVAAAVSAVASADSATLSAASATAASVAANATLWVSGVVVAQDACKISPLDRRTYRKTTASSSTTTDPSADPANYVLISNGVIPKIKVSHRVATGTDGGTSTATTMHTRVLNTTDTNTVTGASLASNQITLPAGTYHYRGRAPTTNGGLNQTFLYNVTDASYTGVGANSNNGGSNAEGADTSISGTFTIAATKVFELRHYVTNGSATVGLGRAVSVPSQVEVYAEIEFEKVS